MKKTYEKKNGKPAYIAVYEKIRESIIGGSYKYGDKLDSKRTTAEKNGVSVVTVEHAYALLCDEGYAEARERSGYFVIYKEKDLLSFPAKRIAPLRQSDRHSVTDFPFSVYAKVMRKTLSDYSERILEKSPNTGCAELRNAISEYLARSRGIRVDSDQIIIGSGAEYLYGLIVQVLGRERVYGIEDPSYEKIEKVYNANGVRPELLSLTAHGISSDALAKSRASVLHITPYRSFPSGVTAPASKRYEYIKWANEREGYIIEDDFESEFSVSSKPEDTLFSIGRGERVIYVNTFSKTIAPSIRVGYMVLPKSLVPVFDEKVGFYTCTVPTFEQFVIAEFIYSGDFERQINRVRRRLRRMQEK